MRMINPTELEQCYTGYSQRNIKVKAVNTIADDGHGFRGRKALVPCQGSTLNLALSSLFSLLLSPTYRVPSHLSVTTSMCISSPSTHSKA